MTIDEVYAELDRLGKLWDRVEETIAGFPCSIPGLRLTVERPKTNGKVRLCFDGRPVAECTMDEKVEAATHFPFLLAAIDKLTDEKGRAAKAAADKLEAWLNS